MKIRIACPLLTGWIVLGLAGAGHGESTAELDTEKEKTLYALGLAVGESIGSLKGQLTEAEIKVILRGFSDAATGKEPLVNLQERMPQLEAMIKERMALAAMPQKDQDRAYLEKASAEAGAVKTASGLVYKELTAGTGPQPEPTDRVEVHYHGTLVDGSVFDSSVQRGEPTSFALNQVIPGWIEGLQMMKVGGKARLVIPSELAYGDGGRPPVIPGGATLIFEVELLGIK